MDGLAGFADTEAMTHGGRLSAAEKAYPDAPQPWLDLSTGINPYAWEGPVVTLNVLRRLPDPADLAWLESVAAHAFGAKPDQVVAMPGSEAGIRLMPRLLGAARVDVVGPTYSSHEQAWRLAGAEVSVIPPEDAADSAAEVLVVVNPNNPDGRTWTPEALAELAQGRWLVVDEAFVETQPGLSVAGLGHERIVVLRSFGKFYGLPGARLGFIVAPPVMAARAEGLRGEWPLSANAMALGVGAYADAAWRRSMVRRLSAAAMRLDLELSRAGLEVVGGTSLFRLVSSPKAERIFERLCRQGVLTRPFAHRPNWLRIGLPPQGVWDRLRAALGYAVS